MGCLHFWPPASISQLQPRNRATVPVCLTNFPTKSDITVRAPQQPFQNRTFERSSRVIQLISRDLIPPLLNSLEIIRQSKINNPAEIRLG